MVTKNAVFMRSVAFRKRLSERYIMRGEIEDSKAELIAEAVDVLSEMTESQIQQFIAMMKATKNVTASI